MSFSRDEPNPLRPYAVRPSFQPTGMASPPPPGPQSHAHVSKPASGPRMNYKTSSRDILPDIDYGEYLHEGSPSLAAMLKSLVDQGLWKYTSILLAQPFEVAKIVLQVQDGNAIASNVKPKPKSKTKRATGHSRAGSYQLSSDDSENDSQSYFTSSAPLSQSTRQRRRRHSSSPSPQGSPSPARSPSRGDHKSTSHIHNLPSPSSINAALSTLWSHEGAWGVWKGTNSTYIHNILHSTITSFFRSLIFAILGLTDSGAYMTTFPGPPNLSTMDISTSASPFLSLLAAVTASGLAGLVLAPVDIARTKIILTPSTHPPRSIIPTLRSLKSWIVPSSIVPATFLHSILPTFVATSTPIFLRSNLGIDPILTPTTYAAATFVSQTVELGIRLPVETALRRGQIAAVRDPVAAPSGVSRRGSSQQAVPLQTVVDVGAYRGLIGTMYCIVFEEGTREPVTKATPARTNAARKHKGQGLPGLFRGWRVGVWGLIGVWGAATLGGGKGGEF